MPKTATTLASGPLLTETAPSAWPRLLTRHLAAAYLSCSTDQIDRMIAAGQLHVVRLPVSRHRNGVPVISPNKRVHIDRAECDDLVARSRE